MRFADYSTLNGWCSTVIGVLFIAAGLPGVFTDAANVWLAIPGVLAVLIPLAALAARRGIPIGQPGRWLTDRPLRRAGHGQSVLPAGPLRRRLIIETIIWAAIALAVVAGFTTSRPFAYATGWASLAYGLLELLGSARRIRQAESEQATTYLVHRRPGLGVPEVTTPSAP